MTYEPEYYIIIYRLESGAHCVATSQKNAKGQHIIETDPSRIGLVAQAAVEAVEARSETRKE